MGFDAAGTHLNPVRLRAMILSKALRTTSQYEPTFYKVDAPNFRAISEIEYAIDDEACPPTRGRTGSAA
jgi:hypothetical protein